METDASTIKKACQIAVNLMQAQDVLPTPDNYALWFAYALQDNKELKEEIDKISKQGVAFTENITHYLHEKYFPKSSEAEAQHAEDVSDMLMQVMEVIGKVQGDAETQNRKLGDQTKQLTSESAKTDASKTLQGIIGQLQEIQQSNQQFARQLEQSQQEADQLRQKLQQSQQESRYDFLTGVLNRRALDAEMAKAIKQSQAKLKPVCLLMIDVDHFKKFNDKWGHQLGDMALKAVANALKKSVRGDDIVARYGGEEFSVLLRETPLEGAKIVGEKIRKNIDISTLKRKDTGKEIEPITVSIGISTFHIGEDDNIPFFIKRADDALYRAKKLGRNNVQLERM
jgi:diguanylate cyclase